MWPLIDVLLPSVGPEMSVEIVLIVEPLRAKRALMCVSRVFGSLTRAFMALEGDCSYCGTPSGKTSTYVCE